jgi:hypothetical protein
VNPSALFPTPRSAAAKRLAQLAGRLDELRTELRGLRTQARDDAATNTDLTAQLHAAQARQHAFGDAEAQVTATRQKLGKLEKSAAERAERLRVCTDAVATVEGAITRHAREHREALEAEQREDATAVAERLAGAVAQLIRAGEDYRTAGARADALLRIVDLERLRLVRTPDLPEAVATFMRSGGGAARVPVPLPVQPGHARVVEAPEPADTSRVVDLADRGEKAA